MDLSDQSSSSSSSESNNANTPRKRKIWTKKMLRYLKKEKLRCFVQLSKDKRRCQKQKLKLRRFMSKITSKERVKGLRHENVRKSKSESDDHVASTSNSTGQDPEVGQSNLNTKMKYSNQLKTSTDDMDAVLQNMKKEPLDEYEFDLQNIASASTSSTSNVPIQGSQDIPTENTFLFTSDSSSSSLTSEFSISFESFEVSDVVLTTDSSSDITDNADMVSEISSDETNENVREEAGQAIRTPMDVGEQAQQTEEPNLLWEIENLKRQLEDFLQPKRDPRLMIECGNEESHRLNEPHFTPAPQHSSNQNPINFANQGIEQFNCPSKSSAQPRQNATPKEDTKWIQMQVDSRNNSTSTSKVGEGSSQAVLQRNKTHGAVPRVHDLFYQQDLGFSQTQQQNRPIRVRQGRNQVVSGGLILRPSHSSSQQQLSSTVPGTSSSTHELITSPSSERNTPTNQHQNSMNEIGTCSFRIFQPHKRLPYSYSRNQLECICVTVRKPKQQEHQEVSDINLQTGFQSLESSHPPQAHMDSAQQEQARSSETGVASVHHGQTNSQDQEEACVLDLSIHESDAESENSDA